METTYLKKCAKIKLNFIEEVKLKQIVFNLRMYFIFQSFVETFHRHLEICFDAEKQSSLEEIRDWFNGRLTECGQKPWRRQGRKWAIAQLKLNLHVSMWQRKDTPL